MDPLFRKTYIAPRRGRQVSYALDRSAGSSLDKYGMRI
jgi:hypothetical protein